MHERTRGQSQVNEICNSSGFEPIKCVSGVPGEVSNSEQWRISKLKRHNFRSMASQMPLEEDADMSWEVAQMTRKPL
jgi:hypothetical protein